MLDKIPEVKKEIEAVRLAGRATAAFTLDREMMQAEEDRRFARANKNSMAAHKSTELQSRLKGFLVEKFDMVTVDLSGALAEARHRVLVPENLCSRCHRALVEVLPSTPTDPPPANGGGGSSP